MSTCKLIHTSVAAGAWLSGSEDHNYTPSSSRNSTIFTLKSWTTNVNEMIPFGLLSATVAGHREGIPGTWDYSEAVATLLRLFTH
jgi:hypothetical protein